MLTDIVTYLKYIPEALPETVPTDLSFHRRLAAVFTI
jgi:hypothetical protein